MTVKDAVQWRAELLAYQKRRSTDKWSHDELVEEVKRLSHRLTCVEAELIVVKGRKPRFGWLRP